MAKEEPIVIEFDEHRGATSNGVPCDSKTSRSLRKLFKALEKASKEANESEAEKGEDEKSEEDDSVSSDEPVIAKQPVAVISDDEDDEDYYDNMGGKDPFLSKLFINILKSYLPTPGYDSIVREMALRFSDNIYHMEWTEAYSKVFKQAKAANPDNKYLFPREVFTRDEIIAFGRMAETNLGVHKDFQISKSCQLLADLLELSRVETLFLQLAIKMSNDLSYQFHHLFEQFRFSDLSEMPARLFAMLFDVTEEEVKAALKGFLIQSGLLAATEARHKPFFYVNEDVREAFCEPDLTVESLTETLFPSNLSTDLDIGTYPHIEKEILRAERILIRSLKDGKRGINIMLWGDPGTGKTELALMMAARNGLNLRVIGDISDRDNSEKSRAQRLVSLKIALKLYQRDPNTVLLFDEMEDLFNKADNNAAFSKAFINRIIDTTPVPIIWTTNDLEILGSAVCRRMVHNIECDIPPADARRLIWQKYNTQYSLSIEESVIEDLADTYDIVPALIHNAAKIASMAGLEANELPEIVQSMDRLVHFGYKRKFDLKVKQNEFYDISCINTDTNLESLTDCLCTAKPNFSLLLYGASGTGKSEFGRYVAKRLNKKVLFKNASDLLGAFVGENEKQIAAAFKKASQMEAVLIIDEGDSFLQDRQGADRSWQISLVNEMLKQMEQHDQPFIITTNLMAHLDPAAMRRFTFKMKFNFLRPEQSETLFERYFGQKAPARIKRMDTLAPGDFAAVKKKASITNITDVDILMEMLVDECDVKPQHSSRMGF